MTAAPTSRYVTRNPDILNGEPTIVGTRVSIRAIVSQWRLGTHAEEIPTQFPQLTLAQVFDALSFYLDNQVEINEYIERNRIPEELIHPVVREALQVK
ncbi:hypothetical protein Lepto7375DRAFT_7979 [Leptolyngbya sp. PCC 7375]|nr:hypothetical protein Lepto7375DRAFT_7979 [Leptolyngbya sp. PCC 7375]